MSTRFYAGQQDYIIQLNLMDDEFDAAVGSITGKANSHDGVFTGTTTIPYLFLNKAANAASGIQWFNTTDNTWTQYMAAGGATNVGPKGNLTAPTGTLVTGTALRSFIDSTAGNGWTWESGAAGSTTPAIVAEITAAGAAKFAGAVTAASFSGNASSATNATNTGITNDTTTNATMYVTWVTGTSGNLPQKVTNTKLTFNPSTGTLSSTTFSGALSGTATNATNTAITNDDATSGIVYPTWVTANTGNLPQKVSSNSFSFIPSTGAITLTGTGSTQATYNRTGSAINTTVAYQNTSGTVYAGHGPANTFAIGATADLNGNNWFRINSTDANFSGNLTIAGNLTVNGTTTTVHSTTVTLDDPVLTLGGDTAPTVDDNKDRGIEFRWHNGTSAKLGFFGFDDSTGRFTFIPDATATSEVYSGTVGTIGANLVGNVTGNVTGNADTATKLATARTITLTGDVTGSVGFDGAANVSITSTVVDDSHNHTISTVTGLQTALDAKYDKAGGVIGNQTTGWSAVASPTARVVDALSGTGGGFSIESYQPMFYWIDRTTNGKSQRWRMDDGTLYIGIDDGTLNDVWTENIRIHGGGYMVVGNGVASADVNFYARGTNVGTATSQYGFFSTKEFNESCTNAGIGFQATLNVKDAPFTVGTLVPFRVSNGVIGAQAKVTAFDGFQVNNITLPGVAGTDYTRVAAFRGIMASGTAKWNLYMDGTASNYLNGKLLIGSTTDSGEKLQVTGTAKFTGSVTITTEAVGDNSTKAASTAFTQQAAQDAAIVYSIVFG